MKIGIDLGTFNSAAAAAVGRKMVMVESKQGLSTYGKNFPSFVRFDHNGAKQAVGKSAKSELALNPKLVIWGVKRLIGLSYEAARERGELKRFQYDIERGAGDSILIKVGEERFTPSHILEYIVREIIEDAQNQEINGMLGGKIEKAVVSVPAYFDGTRVGVIKKAAQSAGLNEIETINEPTAATMAYAHSPRYSSKLKQRKENRILTFDMGAGTLDITIMLMLFEDGEFITGEQCTSGEEALGGIDMDDMLTSYLINKYKLSGIKGDLRSLNTLIEEAEKAKIALSERETATLILPGKKRVELTRAELEDVLKPLLDKCQGPIRVALEQAGLEANRLDHVLFVGGPTYMPCVRAMVIDELRRLGAKEELLQELEGWEEQELPVDPMECVAMGAALKAAGVAEPEIRTDPNGYGTIVEGKYFLPIIPPNSHCPVTMPSVVIIHHNLQALRVPVSLVRKRAYDKDRHTVYKYEHLGDYDHYINPTGELPEIQITLELDRDRVLITKSLHVQRHETVTFVGLNDLKGNEIDLTDYIKDDEIEDDETRKSRKKEKEELRRLIEEARRQKGKQRRVWTQENLEKAVHVARMLINDFAEGSTHSGVVTKKEELLELLEGPLDPRQHAHLVMDRAGELLDALRHAKVIGENDFLNYREDMREIEGDS